MEAELEGACAGLLADFVETLMLDLGTGGVTVADLIFGFGAPHTPFAGAALPVVAGADDVAVLPADVTLGLGDPHAGFLLTPVSPVVGVVDIGGNGA